MQLLYFFESIRNPVCDAIMSAVTFCGGEVVFMAVAILVFWCISKRDGYFLLTTCFIGTVINQFLKLMFRIPRPWVQDPDFTIVESARAEATGYSFPSGHTQNVVGTFGGIARMTKRIWLRVVCIVIVVLTAISRMYLGVHTLLDVGVALVTGVVLVLVLYPLFCRAAEKPSSMYWILGSMGVIAVAYTLFTELYAWPSDIDPENLASGIKNGYTMIGCVAGMAIAYWMDERFLHFDVKAPLWAQVLKLVLGLTVVVALRAVLKQPLLALFHGHGIANAVRYFIMVLFAAGIWPMTFGWFSRGCRRKEKKQES
jgi:undecaprenyl-diphosphatase